MGHNHAPMNAHLVQTGRTARQLSQAIALAHQGYRVNYVMENLAIAEYMSKRLKRDWPKDHHLISVIGLPDDFNWDTMRPNGIREPMHQRIWIVDHDTAEKAYLRMAQRVADMQRCMQQIYPYTTGETMPLPPGPATRRAELRMNYQD